MTATPEPEPAAHPHAADPSGAADAADLTDPSGVIDRSSPALDPDESLGIDAVRAALGRARAAAAAQGLRPGRPGRPAASPRRRRRVPGEFSGAHPDARDPQTFSSSVTRLVTELGWTDDVAVGGVIGRWPSIIGERNAEHCTAESFDDGVLTVVTSSTAWATQIKLMAPNVLARIAEELGDGVVTRLVVRGPAAPSWRKGRFTISDGRGPRDTYG